MLRPAPYLSQKLTRSIRTKDGGTLRSVLDARTYMLALSEDRELRAQWQRACELLLAEADIDPLSGRLSWRCSMTPSLMLRQWIPHEGPGRGERAIVMRQINIWIVIAILLARLLTLHQPSPPHPARLGRRADAQGTRHPSRHWGSAPVPPDPMLL